MITTHVLFSITAQSHSCTISIQPIDDWRELNSIHQILLQLVSAGLIGPLNQKDQFEN